MTPRIVDVRPRADYLLGHVPGAVHLDPESDLTGALHDPSAGGRHPLPDPAVLAVAFARAGIDRDTFVLALDEGTGWAARCWWLLRHLGHDACGTFDLRSYAGPLVDGEEAVPPAAFEARPRTGDTIEPEEILARLGDPTLLLLDARAPARWRGDEEPLDPVAGRIPGAVNAFFEDPAPPPQALSHGDVAVYCGSGVTAAVVVQKLVLAGREEVRMYPGSFSEWCRREGYPIERGASPS